ncbi:acyl-CoA dehydrogenase family protein [Chloroflexota bacterium]
MDFALTEEQEMLKTMARDYLDENCPRPADMLKSLRDDERGYPPELWKGMADLEWMGLAFPEKYGGAGGSFLDLTVLLEEAGRACLPAPFFSSVVLGGLTILEAGSEEQKQEMLPKVSKGELILTMALTEEDTRYNQSAMTVKATPDSGNYIINGTKLFVPNAHVADYIICVARVKEGITLFLIDGKSLGIETTMLQTIDWSKQCAVIFNNVKVPKENILGEVGKGWEMVEKVLEKAKIGTCADTIGSAGRAMEMAIDYAKERVQFGVHIGSFEVIQHYCSDMAIALGASRWATYKAAWMLSEGMPCAQWVAMAKAYVSSACQKIVFTATHVHGSIGMTVDHDMPLLFSRCKVNELTYGSADENLDLVAQEMGL